MTEALVIMIYAIGATVLSLWLRREVLHERTDEEEAKYQTEVLRLEKVERNHQRIAIESRCPQCGSARYVYSASLSCQYQCDDCKAIFEHRRIPAWAERLEPEDLVYDLHSPENAVRICMMMKTFVS